MIEALAFLFGGLSRVIDGTGKVKGSNVLVFVVAFGVGYFWHPVWWQAILIGASCYWSLQKGFNDWHKFSLAQITHYYPMLLPGLAVAQEDFMAWAMLITACLIAGLSHPVFALLERKFFNGWHYTRYAEFIAGACVIGPWSLA